MTTRVMHLITAMIIFAAGAAIFTLFLPDQFTLAEAHIVLLAQSMVSQGWQPIAKAYRGIYDSHFSAIPSLLYLMTKIPGVHLSISARTAVLPAAAASGMTLAVTYLIGTLRSKEWGTLSVLFLLAIEAFFLHSRTLSVYPFLTAVITLALFVTITCETEGILFYLLFSIVLLLGFALIGAIGLLLPLLMAVIYLLWRGQWMKCLCILACGLATLVAAEAILLGLALGIGSGDPTLVKASFSAQLTAILPHAMPLWNQASWHELLYFILPLLAALFTVIGCWRPLITTRQSWEMQFLRSQLSWVALIVLLTIFLPKSPPFLLLTAPPLALMGAYLFSREQPTATIMLLRHLLTFIFIAVPILTLIMTGAAFVYSRLNQTLPSPFYLSALVLLFFFTMLSLFLGFPGTVRRHKNSASLFMTAIIAYLIFNFAVVLPALTSQRQQQNTLLPTAITLLKAQPDAAIVFYKIAPGNEDQLLMVRLPWQKRPPTFIKQAVDIIKSKPGSYFITTRRTYDKLSIEIKTQTNVVTKGHINNQSLLLFTYGTPPPSTKK